MKRKPEPMPTGEVITIRPALLRDRDAATYLGRSASWIRAQRAEDVRAKREGRTTQGPPWIVIGGASVFYKTTDLDAWIAANGEPLGVVAFSNRGGKAQQA